MTVMYTDGSIVKNRTRLVTLFDWPLISKNHRRDSGGERMTKNNVGSADQVGLLHMHSACSAIELCVKNLKLSIESDVN